MPRLPAAIPAALALLLGPAALTAQGGTVRGRVADSLGGPVGRATVSLEGTALRAVTTERGEYALRGVPAGTWTLRVRALGYASRAMSVTVAPGQSVTHDVTLASQAIGLSPIDVVVGSRARHTAADELAVPVDIYMAEDIAAQGTRETGQILQALSPSVNFPRQSVTDATDIVRPFTLRGLSPDHTLVLLNGWRRHQTAVVNTFAYGTGAGSSGVDMNAIPAAAIDRIEVLRDGASAQYGSDAIAGVINAVIKEGPFSPFLNVTTGRYIPDEYPDDGTTVGVSGGWGFRLGRGSLALFGEFLDREPTNRAWADPYEDAGTGATDSVSSTGQVIVKRNPVAQPNHHWGDGLEKDVLSLANLRIPLSDAGTSELYAFGGYSFREGTGNGYRRCASSCASSFTGPIWTEIHPLGFLPEFNPDVTDYSATGGFRALAGGWSVDLGLQFGHNDFAYNLRNTLNVSLGPCLDPAAPCAPGPDGTPGTGDEMANQTSFFAGSVLREELGAGVTVARALSLGLPAPVSLAVGAAFRRERFQITRGELASYVDGGHLPPDSAGADGIFVDDPATPGTDESADNNLDARSGSQVFPGFSPSDETDANRSNFGIFADAETNLTPKLLVNVAARFESYSDFGEAITGKAAVRFQPSPRVTARAAASTGFRAPGLGQSHFSKIVTNVIGGVVTDVGIFPVADSAARLLGARPLREETSLNLSAGVAWSPGDNITFTADYFRITINDRILLGATFDDSVTLAILAGHGLRNVGGVQYFTNGLDTRTQGVDLTANMRLSAAAGVVNLTAGVNYTQNEITHFDSIPQILRDSGSTEPGIIDSVTYIGITEERPDWRATVTARYSRGRFQALVRASYFGKFSSAQPGFCDDCRDRYGAKTLFDAELGYRFAQASLAVGMRNLFDTYPDQPSGPFKDYNNNGGVFPWAAASPFGYNGRFVYARLETTLGL